jgi:predicted ATPase
VGETYRRAERLAATGGQQAKLYAILQGQFHHHAVRGEIGRCLQLAERCHAMARSGGDPVLLLGAHYALCAGVCWRGEFAAAKAHLDEVLRLEDVLGRRPLRSLIGIDLRVFARAYGCHALWHLGLVDQAAALGDEAAALARSDADPFSLVIALSYGAMLRQFGHDPGAAERLAREAIGVCAEHHFAYYLAWATIIRGWAQATAGDVDEGLAGLRRGLADIEATGARLRRPYYLSLLADALARAGRVEEALAALEEALATSEASGERWRDADLHRLRGRLLLALPDRCAGDAETCFTAALDLARRQNAPALELQAALDLARLWAEEGRRREAHELLAPIRARHTEGLDTPDLAEVATLLEALG